ncbi:hypothetical protein BJ165DRAFT_1475475 [Panaeolus papilionaceus]|nr:hypothetical protein BJ165DRAFT_1475475 [Panaeolus papilionaceus]
MGRWLHRIYCFCSEHVSRDCKPVSACSLIYISMKTHRYTSFYSFPPQPFHELSLMSVFSFSKVRSLWEPEPKPASQNARRHSDSNRTLESDPDMHMVGSYSEGVSTSRAQGVARSSSVAPSPFPQQIRKQQESRLRDNHRTGKDSQAKNYRSPTPKVAPTMPTPSNYPTASSQASAPPTTNSPVIPSLVSSQNMSDAKRNYFGLTNTGDPKNGEPLMEWEKVPASKPSTAAVATERPSSEAKTRPLEDNGKRVRESPRRRDPGISTDDEQANWKAEKRHMAREIEGLMKERAQLLSDNEQLKQQFAKSQEKLGFADQTLAEDKHLIEALNLQVTSLKQAHTQLSDHAKMVEDRTREFESYCGELQAGYQQLENETRVLRVKAREADERNGRLEQLKRTEEQMRGLEHYSKTFLTMEDKFSGADVLKMVEALNAEIFQASAYLAGLVEDVPKEQMKRVKWPQCVSQEAYKTIQKRVGPALMDFIEEKGPDNRRDPLALQLAFQAILVWWATYMVNTFADGVVGSEIGLLYKYIRETEPQAVSARWRAITSEKMGKLMKPTFTNFITYAIGGILKMGGATFPPGGRNALAVQESILQIEKVWKQIKAAGKEGIISCEVDLAYSDPGSPFDPATMEDSYQEEGMYSPSDMVDVTVLCPVAVGLKRSWAKRSDGGQSSLQDEILLKPKVVLSSVFNHIGDFSVVMDDTMHHMLRELQEGR